EDRPAGALDPGGVLREVLLEAIEGAEVFVDGGAQLTIGLSAAFGGEVVPEDRVVHVSAEVEREVLLVQVHGGEVASVASCGKLLKRSVGSGDVCLMVLAVVQLHDLRRDVWFQGSVVVRKFGKCVVSHHLSIFSLGGAVNRATPASPPR